MVFGDGPDGGREAVLDGALDFPTTADPWNGYIVMQAKFLQVPKTSAEDANWLAAQLDVELQKFVAPGSRLRKPRYYILVSNARLSPQPSSARGKGGIAKVDAVFSKYRKRLGLVGWRVWHLDQLATYLAGADGLRRSYAAWLSSSDVISDLLEEVGSRHRAVGEALYRYLARELRTHQPVRLQQAGHSGEAATMIEDVFTDLPFKPMNSAPSTTDLPLLSALLDRSRDRLDRESVDAQAREITGRPERILLIGGPGQGKSTVSQFMGQMMRANVLRSDRSGRLPADISRIVNGTLAAATSIVGDQPLPRRIPFRIDLPSFADRLSEAAEGRLTLLRYLAGEVARIADADINVEDIRRWIVEQPTAFVLDGLDEVPPSANRTAVVNAIGEFWDEAHTADLQMVVTTRPQGYNDDLDPTLYVKYEMMPLGPDQAVAYALRLAKNRLSDHVQRERVVGRMREAARSPTTSRLMVSPLQVAILLALIDQRGDAPSDRWTLFDKYFAVVLEREQGKVGPVGEAMRVWSRQIVSLHHRAGFLLHVDAETRGNSEAYLVDAELRDLVRDQLAEEGFEGLELDRITSDLLAASTQRLVLLVQREEGRFGFEVRSLQEFMAAAHLMAGSEALVQRRLETIANRSHWLHVFQIASSKCFAVPDSQHLRDTVVMICRALNDAGDELDRYLRTGSRLALSLLNDGLAFDAPRYRRTLVALAIEILVRGPEALPSTLKKHCASDFTRSTGNIRPHFTSTLEKPRLAAWLLLMRLAADGCDWALDWLSRETPRDEESSAILIALAEATPHKTALDAFLRTTLEQAPPNEIARQFDRLERDKSERRNRIVNKSPCLRILTQRADDIVPSLIISQPTELSLPLASIEVGPKFREVYADIPATPAWEAVRAVVAFHRNPSAAELGSLLNVIKERGWDKPLLSMRLYLPWPLATALMIGRLSGDLNAVAAHVATGGFGDLADWRQAEVRWREDGVTQNDIERWRDGEFFGPDVGQVGAPWTSLRLTHSDAKPVWVDWLLELAMRSAGAARAHLQAMTTFVVSLYPPCTPLNATEAAFLLENGHGREGDARLDPRLLAAFPEDLLRDITILDLLDSWGKERHVFLDTEQEGWREAVVRALAGELDSRPGLLAFVGSALAVSSTPLEWAQIPRPTLVALAKSAVPVIEGYARVLQTIFGDLRSEHIDRVIDIGKIDYFPPALLHRFLEDNRIDRDLRHNIGELVAGRLNKGDDDIEISFFGVLTMIADQRLSPFGQEVCWNSLALGEALFKLVGKRGRSEAVWRTGSSVSVDSA
ncbi:hypothetical protein GCM10011390_21820 [Aureimonas endophytica]|uniref:NACHT domain-containing protein n=2 Tax=Aureimonas endophytica TaxID=2027858 RepID=A0A917E5G1_9HYPH|nr:hypothetical protein GCM10011390_21820 [Aureimonas endophytica]